jgi:hypothetical protein
MYPASIPQVSRTFSTTKEHKARVEIVRNMLELFSTPALCSFVVEKVRDTCGILAGYIIQLFVEVMVYSMYIH